jgi:hypothetical protein
MRLKSILPQVYARIDLQSKSEDVSQLGMGCLDYCPRAEHVTKERFECHRRIVLCNNSQ